MTVLGLDREVVEQLGVWRSDWAANGAERDELAETIDIGRKISLRGVQLSAGKIALRVGPGLLSFAAVVETPEGDFRRVELGAADPDIASNLVGRVTRGSRLVSLELVPPPRLIERGADSGTAFNGAIVLTGELARELQTWTGLNGVVARPSGSGVELRFVLTPQRTARLRARQVTDQMPPLVLVSRRLAELAGGVGGSLPLQVGGALVSVRVAGVVDRFPGTSGEVAIGERGALRTAINAAAPGAARENEVWLDVSDERLPAVADAFARPPLEVLTVVTRADLEDEARRDPLAYGTLLALGAAALLALVLAATGLALSVRSDLRDERSELYELEAQGASPSLLRRVLRSRAVALSIAGLLAGAVTGAVLVTLVTRVVSVTARGGFAEPPLAATVDRYAGLAALFVGATTRRAFSQPHGPTHRGY